MLRRNMTNSAFKQQGFTLIELVVVIVLLGVLAAFALPKFSDLSNEAYIAQAKGIAGSFQAGVKIVQSVHFSQGLTGRRVQNLSGYDDGTVDVNEQGFPIGTDKGNGNSNIGRGNNGCAAVWVAVLSDGAPSVANGNNNQDYRSFRHDSNRSCSYALRSNDDTAGRTQSQIVIRYNSSTGLVDVCGQSSQLPNC
ncbi:hypothetical protein A3760_01745 [Oleiphilus sp. HI0122]|nr:hypothetical protein A3760_01745 [Oleiphilus sp. HI0122]